MLNGGMFESVREQVFLSGAEDGHACCVLRPLTK
uniref:Uncharacterized protein n=1 Tax=Arundo donax TaxID=35708 RepID=A0A0A8YPX8_ARUDO